MLTQANTVALTPRQWMLLERSFNLPEDLAYHRQHSWVLAAEYIVTGRSLAALAPRIGLSLPKDLKQQEADLDYMLIRLVPQTWHQFLEHLERTIENWTPYVWSKQDR